MAKWKITPTDQMKSLVEGQVQEGDHFELMVTFEKEGNQWCITEIEGQKAPGYDNKKEKRGEGGDVAAAYTAARHPPSAPPEDMGGDYGAT